MGKITYEYLSMRDLHEAKVLLNGMCFSSAGRFAQQAIEKQLKQYIETHGDSGDLPLLSIHNTTRLYDRVVELGGLSMSRETRKMMAVLKDYYYDINYPGDNCRELEEYEAAEAVEFAETLISQLRVV